MKLAPPTSLSPFPIFREYWLRCFVPSEQLSWEPHFWTRPPYRGLDFSTISVRTLIWELVTSVHTAAACDLIENGVVVTAPKRGVFQLSAKYTWPTQLIPNLEQVVLSLQFGSDRWLKTTHWNKVADRIAETPEYAPTCAALLS